MSLPEDPTPRTKFESFNIAIPVNVPHVAEHSGGNVNYYLVNVEAPKRLEPYTAECEDIIEALGMTFAEGCAFKALWRSCAARTLGLLKKGGDGIYDADKIIYYGSRIKAQREKCQKG